LKTGTLAVFGTALAQRIELTLLATTRAALVTHGADVAVIALTESG
jgi:hypothetical protein